MGDETTEFLAFAGKKDTARLQRFIEGVSI